MPPLNEGMIFYMPTTLPGISVTQSARLLQTKDRILKSFPEVEWVLGKAGRAETSTDPAQFSMGETTVMLKPESQWRPGMTWDKLVDEIDQKTRLPGVANAWTMPMKTASICFRQGFGLRSGLKCLGPT
jgi:Cu(I)/Ag(I) efflux system membrane protein CusA/SilA